jgi:hypothetical protein
MSPECARARKSATPRPRTPTPAHAAEPPPRTVRTIAAGWRGDAYEPIIGPHNEERACKCVGELPVTLHRAVARSCLRPMMVLNSTD